MRMIIGQDKVTPQSIQALEAAIAGGQSFCIGVDPSTACEASRGAAADIMYATTKSITKEDQPSEEITKVHRGSGTKVLKV